MSTEGPAQDMSADEFAEFNRLAVMMESFVRSPLPLRFPFPSEANTNSQHSHFRRAFRTLHKAATTRTLPPNTTPRTLIFTGLNFCRSLSTHHAIEEAHIFPHLATRMPEFRHSGEEAAELLRHHEVMHEGLEELGPYLERCWKMEEELDLAVLEGLLSWGDVLLEHLDREVEALGAGNMKRYWSLEEVRAMPW